MNTTCPAVMAAASRAVSALDIVRTLPVIAPWPSTSRWLTHRTSRKRLGSWARRSESVANMGSSLGERRGRGEQEKRRGGVAGSPLLTFSSSPLPGQTAPARSRARSGGDSRGGEAADQGVGVLVAHLERVLADDLAADRVAGGGERLELEAAAGQGHDLDARAVEQQHGVAGDPAAEHDAADAEVALVDADQLAHPLLGGRVEA